MGNNDNSKGKSFNKSERSESNWKKNGNNYQQGRRDNRQNGRPNNWQQNRSNNGQQRGQNNGAELYVGAPYNFVPFNDATIEVSAADMAVHDRITDELLSGEISYKIEAKTPICVSSGGKNKVSEFYRNERNVLSVPGSTMRGLIRNNVQILGLSGFDQDIDDYNLMYRDVTGNTKNAKCARYNDILGSKPVQVNGKPLSVLKNVAAGYIRNEGGKYYIYKTGIDRIALWDNSNCEADNIKMNYYVVSARHIVANWDDFPFFDNHANCLMFKKGCVFTKTEKNGRTHYVPEDREYENKNYRPNFTAVSYEEKSGRIINIGDEGIFSKKGYLVGTGNMREKKAVYVVPEIDESRESIEIPTNDVRAFEIDYNRKQNTLKTTIKDDELYKLPKKGETKPVFYIELYGHVYFGYTPRLRIFYDYTIKKGYKQKLTDYDYAKSIFGCTENNAGFKSKVSFSDAVICNKGSEEVHKNVILAEPKPSSFLDYLVQDGETATYSTKNFTLRGVKQYWLHNGIIDSALTTNQNIGSNIQTLAAGTTFTGKIRFQNLKKTELGLVLWALKLEKDSQMNIGKAKAYGYGRIKVNDVSLKLINNAKAYSSTSLILNPTESHSVEEFITLYKNELKRQSGKDYNTIPAISNFFKMKDITKAPDESKIRYMSIGTGEYQSRKKPLQTVDKLVEGTK